MLCLGLGAFPMLDDHSLPDVDSSVRGRLFTGLGWAGAPALMTEATRPDGRKRLGTERGCWAACTSL